ncbi:hypothetical protein BDQ17DRAFT_1330423 [Cyathus striatus]|nr:hypothetical protein BDQ17DRAFT_1330423 [Cyathus striatus]
MLETAVSSILPQLDSLASSGTTTSSSISPLLAELIAALGSASSSLGGLQGNVRTDSTSAKTVADATAPILNNTATSLNNVKVANPAIVQVFGAFGIDAAINEVLLGLEVVVTGILTPLGALLCTVAGLLGGLGFILSLLTLGLGIL